MHRRDNQRRYFRVQGITTHLFRKITASHCPSYGVVPVARRARRGPPQGRRSPGRGKPPAIGPAAITAGPGPKPLPPRSTLNSSLLPAEAPSCRGRRRGSRAGRNPSPTVGPWRSGRQIPAPASPARALRSGAGGATQHSGPRRSGESHAYPTAGPARASCRIRSISLYESQCGVLSPRNHLPP